jgi:fatty acid-binding protein DegV
MRQVAIVTDTTACVPPEQVNQYTIVEAATNLKEIISSRFDCQEIYITEFTPVMGMHTEPGLVSVAFYEE